MTKGSQDVLVTDTHIKLYDEVWADSNYQNNTKSTIIFHLEDANKITHQYMVVYSGKHIISNNTFSEGG